MRPRPPAPPRFSRAYFDKWYRDPRHRVKTSTELARQAALVVSATEYLLARPLRSVLDVGCGEGNWFPVLRRVRAGVRYYGVDASEYAVRRYGRRRNIQLGTIADLGVLHLPKTFDLILCVGMLNYLSPPELESGLGQLHDRAAGVVYLELFTSHDRGVVGDTRTALLRSPAWYRRTIRKAGFLPCGMHCYLPDRLREQTAELERCGR